MIENQSRCVEVEDDENAHPVVLLHEACFTATTRNGSGR